MALLLVVATIAPTVPVSYMSSEFSTEPAASSSRSATLITFLDDDVNGGKNAHRSKCIGHGGISLHRWLAGMVCQPLCQFLSFDAISRTAHPRSAGDQ